MTSFFNYKWEIRGMSKERERKECENNAGEGILLLETKNVFEIGFKSFEYKKVKFNLNASVNG